MSIRRGKSEYTPATVQIVTHEEAKQLVKWRGSIYQLVSGRIAKQGGVQLIYKRKDLIHATGK